MTWRIEFSDEVADWYEELTVRGAAQVDRVVGMLAQRGNLLRMPQSRALGDGLFELRFTCEDVARRITYTFEPDRKVLTLTTFRKQRQNEQREIDRARRTQRERRDRLPDPRTKG
jgi:hypothetical protein